jgi:hypothetical protein
MDEAASAARPVLEAKKKKDAINFLDSFLVLTKLLRYAKKLFQHCFSHLLGNVSLVAK